MQIEKIKCDCCGKEFNPGDLNGRFTGRSIKYYCYKCDHRSDGIANAVKKKFYDQHAMKKGK